MSRGVVVVVALLAIACRRETEPAPREPAGSGRAVLTDASAPVAVAPIDAALTSQLVDLLHATHVTVAVSSVVANPAISPWDLVDGDLATAWNSRTGDNKAWIAFRVPPSTRVVAIRMTAGFTGTGPEGDYFLMNRRIQKVRIWHDGIKLRDAELDVEQRGLQDIAIGANGGDYKIEVIATVPGTKKAWREVAISELQVMGNPPPGSPIVDDLTMTIGSLDGQPLTSPALQLSAEPRYASLDAFCKEANARPPVDCVPIDPACRRTPQAPRCGVDVLDASVLPPLPAGLPARWFGIQTAMRDEKQCGLAIDVGGEVAILELGSDDECGRVNTTRWDSSPNVRFEVAFHGRWLVIVTSSLEQLDTATTRTENLRICAVDARTVDCTMPIAIGEIESAQKSGGEPGADGMYVDTNEKWQFDYKLKGDTLFLTKLRGTPDEYAASKLGRHPLVR